MEQSQMRFYRTLTCVIVIGVILSSCSLHNTQQTGNNPNAVFTAAAYTVEAKLTLGAVLEPTDSLRPTIPPPNPSQTPTITPAQAAVTTDPNQVCDAAKFVTDVTIPDGTKLISGESFTKTWRFINIGT